MEECDPHCAEFSWRAGKEDPPGRKHVGEIVLEADFKALLEF